MSFTFPITVNLQILSRYHLQPITQEVEGDLNNLDTSNYTEVISFSNIRSQEHLIHLKQSLSNVLSQYRLESHLDHLLYLNHCLWDMDLPTFIYQEDLKKHAYDTVSNLLELTIIKEECKPRDLIIKISSRTKGYSSTLNMPLAIKGAWKSLYESVVKSARSFGNNQLLSVAIADKEITKELLIDLKKQFKVRKASFFMKALGSFTFLLRDYLDGETPLKTPTSAKLSNEQARFIFDLLEQFGYLSNDQITSNKENYLRTLMKNAFSSM